MFYGLNLFIGSVVLLVVYLISERKRSTSYYLYLFATFFTWSNILTVICLSICALCRKPDNFKLGIDFFNSYYIVVNLLSCFVIYLIMSIGGMSIIRGTKRGKIGNITGFIVLFVFFSISMLAVFGSIWTINNFGLLTADQLLYHLFVPLEGSNDEFIKSFVLQVLIWAVASSIVLSYFVLNPSNYHTRFKTLKYEFLIQKTLLYKFLIFNLISIPSFLFGSKVVHLDEMIASASVKSPFFETNYVSANETKLIFPEKKRNLIYIFVESLETTFTSTEMGGVMKENYLQPLTDIASEGIVFTQSDSKDYIGASTLTGSGWTIAAMVAQTAGIPLKVTTEGNEYASEDDDKFLPGVVSIGDILAENGYNQMIMVGSDLTFGGRRSYFTQHGNYQVFDYLTAKEKKLIPEDYKVWWGFEDSKLFDYAKTEITTLASEEEPFNFTMLTANTHHVDGYLEEGAPEPYNQQYSNVYAYTATQLAEFINWLKSQDFYENTTVVVVGDHLSMDGEYFNKNQIDSKDRRVFNLYLNAPENLTYNVEKVREFSTMDFYPTTIASLGVSIQGNRLGLGANLFSHAPTLMELYGEDINKRLSETSEFYNKTLLKE